MEHLCITKGFQPHQPRQKPSFQSQHQQVNTQSNIFTLPVATISSVFGFFGVHRDRNYGSGQAHSQVPLQLAPASEAGLQCIPRADAQHPAAPSDTRGPGKPREKGTDTNASKKHELFPVYCLSNVKNNNKPMTPCILSKIQSLYRVLTKFSHLQT